MNLSTYRSPNAATLIAQGALAPKHQVLAIKLVEKLDEIVLGRNLREGYQVILNGGSFDTVAFGDFQLRRFVAVNIKPDEGHGEMAITLYPSYAALLHDQHRIGTSDLNDVECYWGYGLNEVEGPEVLAAIARLIITFLQEGTMPDLGMWMDDEVIIGTVVKKYAR